MPLHCSAESNFATRADASTDSFFTYIIENFFSCLSFYILLPLNGRDGGVHVMRDRRPIDLFKQSGDGDGPVGKHKDREGQTAPDLFSNGHIDLFVF